MSFDLPVLGRPSVTIDGDHYFHIPCPFVPIYPNLTKQNKFEVKIMIPTGETVGLTKEIIDVLHILLYISRFYM